MKNNNVICPVCGQHIFSRADDHDICPICGWENESYHGPGGANDLDLESYKERYIKYTQLIKGYQWKIHHFPKLDK